MSEPRVLLGLLGANIMGSLSPAIFADAFAANGIDGFYHLMDVERLNEKRLPKLLDAVKAAGFAGVNITYPFKRDILPLLDAVDAEAVQVGAVNTVAIAADGKTRGYNFDRRGWRNSFIERIGRDRAEGKAVVLVGAGGAGRAVAFALMDLDVSVLTIADRDSSAAAALHRDVTSHFAGRARLAADLDKEIAAAAGVVNATQTGMRGFPGNPVPTAVLSPAHWAADVIYTPIETEFLKAAAARGARTLNGGGMCVHQAVEAFRQFTGLTPDLRRMHQAFESARVARDAGFAAQDRSAAS